MATVDGLGRVTVADVGFETTTITNRSAPPWEAPELDAEPADACPHCKATDGFRFINAITGMVTTCNRCGRDIDEMPDTKTKECDCEVGLCYHCIDKPEPDAINPAYYAGLTPDPADTIEGWKLDVWKGNALKYIARGGRKIDREFQTPEIPFGLAAKHSEIKDLKKAVWYLQRRQKLLRQQILDAGSPV